MVRNGISRRKLLEELGFKEGKEVKIEQQKNKLTITLNKEKKEK